MDSILILDASGYIYRSYFAIQGMSSKKGESTNALYGFTRSVLRLLNKFPSQYVVSVFDAERNKESRLKIYSEYKATRKPTPPDLIDQIHEAKTFCSLMGIPSLGIPGVEADDTMGSISQFAKKHNLNVFICTSDKDMAQLVDEHVSLINPHKDDLVIDEKKVEETYGVKPNQIRDYLAIIGDTSDNIPGLEGFGPKTAVSLLHKYGSLDSILKHAHEIGGKKETILTEQKDIGLLCKQLVEIDTNVEIPKELEFYKILSPQKEQLHDFLKQKGFQTIIKSLDLFKESTPTRPAQTILVFDEKDLDHMLEELKNEHILCVDTETTDLKPVQAQLVGIGIGKDAEKIYYIPFNAKLEKNLILDKLKPFFESAKHSFYGHNIKYDYHVLKNAGIELMNIAFDTMLASYILNAGMRRHSLDELSMQYFDKKKISIDELIGKGKKQISMMEVPLEKISEYCAEDVEYTIRLYEVLTKELKVRNLEKLLYDIEIPLIKILAKMERRGIFLDSSVLKTLSVHVEKEIQKLQEEIFQLAGEPFNINSPKQLSEILYQKLNIPTVKKGRTMPSTSAEVLELLQDQYPIAKKLIDYRTLEKLRSTYIDTLPNEINPETNRIHCTFNQSVAATGRLSCTDPNLQNIPIRSELGREIRKAFRPQLPNVSFLSFDYSQIELRILAHVSEDESLIDAFNHNKDIHAQTASEIFGVHLKSVTPEMRRQAKAVNFGIIYGQQAFGLSQELRISITDATSFINRYFKRFSKVKEFIERTKEEAHKTQKAVTLTGRERLIPEINSTNQILKNAAERLAINTPFQGTAADIIKLAMIEIDKWISTSHTKTSMLLQIHDELLFEVPDSEIETVTPIIKNYMETVYPLKVPTIVEIGVGKNWKECYN